MVTFVAVHESAIAMAKDALSKAQHAELKTKAQQVIDTQQKEIDQLKAWRDAWYKTTATTGNHCH